MQNRCKIGYSPGLLKKIQFGGTHSFTWAERENNAHGQHSNPDRSIRRTLGETCNTVDGVAFSFGNWSFWSMINLIMLHERNRYIYYGQGLVGFLGAPSSECSENKSLSESTQRSTPQVLLSNALWDSLRTKKSSVCLGFNLARMESSPFSSRWMA